MAELQNIQIQQLQIAKSHQSSQINMKLIQQESFEDDPEKIELKIVTENSQVVNPQKIKEKSFTIRATKTSQQNKTKLPRVKSSKEIGEKEGLNGQRFINKYRKSSSVKKLDKSKSLKLEQIKRDIIRHPLKYKIVQQLFICKPQVIYNLNQSQINFIQQENMKIKGDNYLREALSKIKNRKQHIKTQPSSLPKKIKTFKVSLTKLIQMQEAKGNKLVRKIKNHQKKGNSSIFAHLDSSASIDKAFVSFLKTKIKRAELACKN